MTFKNRYFASAILTALSATLCVSCTETTPPNSNPSQAETTLPPATITRSMGSAGQIPEQVTLPSNPAAPDPVRPAQPRPRAAAVSVAADPVPQAAPVAIPKDAQWTIHCATYSGLDHVARMTQLRAALAQKTAWPYWYVVHQSNESSLFYGYYKSINDATDAKESQRAQAEKARIVAFQDDRQSTPFGKAMFVNLDAPDPSSPPEWNLLNAKGHWTVEIAAYRDSQDRKQAAVDSVRSARAQGIEAYYYHGDAISSVCIGAWPESAVYQPAKDEMRQARRDGNDMIVLPPGMAPAAIDKIEDDNRGVAKVVQSKIEIKDPSILETLRKYPVHSVNGNEEVLTRTVPGTDKKVSKPVASMLMEIPERTTSVLGGGNGNDAVAPPAVDMLRPQRSTNGGLRGIGQ